MRSRLGMLHPVPPIAAITRQMQGLRSHQPLRGLTRLSNLLDRLLPAYQGTIRLRDGVLFSVNSRQPAERWILYAGNYQPPLTAFLKQHTPTGGRCVDIGANLGFYTLHFAQWVGSGGQVTAFEANPALVARIRHDLALNAFDHVTVIDVPVHARVEPVTFYVSASPGKSSIHAGQVSAPVNTRTVTATTVDAAAEMEAWDRVDVIKIDIEGNDCNALLGARETLRRFRPVLAFEYWYNTPPDIADATFTLLDNLGYRLERLMRNGRRVAFDPHRARDGLRHIDILGIVPDER